MTGRSSVSTLGGLALAALTLATPASAQAAPQGVTVAVLGNETGSMGLALRWLSNAATAGWGYVAELTHTDRSESWIGAGVSWAWQPASQPFLVRLALMPGLYEAGDGRELGGRVEFSSSLEISWPMRNEGRFSMAVSHLSNGGIYDYNPGINAVRIGWTIPLGG